MAYARVTLTGLFTQLDGTPAVGSATITPSVPTVTDAGDVILTGPVKVALDVDGRLTVDLPATDDPHLSPTGFTYAVMVAMHHAYWSTNGLSLPASAGTVDLASVPASEVVEYETVTGAQAKADEAQAAAIAAAAADLDAHEAATTSVHGIVDTAVLETQTGAQARVDAHVDDTTAHPASAVVLTPVGTVTATDVQAAVAELDAEKETPAGAQAKVDAHSADTTGVHGIADTAALETQAGAQAKADAAQSAATATAAGDLDAHETAAGAHPATSITVEVRRNAVINPRAAVDRAGALSYTGTSATIARLTGQAGLPAGVPGDTVFQVSWAAGAGQPGMAVTAALPTGDARIGSLWVKRLSGTGGMAAAFIGVKTGAVVNPPLGTWTRLDVSLAPGDAAVTAFGARIQGNAPDAGSMLVVGLLAEKSTVAGSYFDGSTSPDPDLTPEWLGTAHASASRLIGTAQVTLSDLIARVTALENP